MLASLNPLTGERLGEVSTSDAAVVQAAVKSAHAAQVSWGALSVAERARRVHALRQVLERRNDEIAALIAAETGKTELEAFAMEVTLVRDLVSFYVRRAEAVLAPRKIPLHFMRTRASYLHYAPRGVVGIIAPWNFPFSIAGGELVMALLAGNAVVLKPSEHTPLVGRLWGELCRDAGIPSDLVQVVQGDGDVGRALLDAGIDYCVFTGSVATGRKVAARCGELLIPCTVELGGKAPAIICADADIDRTARALVWGAFANQGQVCASVERVYAHRTVHDALVDRIIEHTATLRAAPDASGDVDIGSMTWQGQLEHVERQIAEAVAKGARVRAGGARTGRGLQLAPTVITHCREDMALFRKETFGPVLAIAAVEDDEEALRRANDSDLGLLAYVFSTDAKKAQRLAERIQSGTVMINDVLTSYAMVETPWGGVKRSGLGRTHGDDGLRALCEERHVNYDRLAMTRELWWYPYSSRVAARAKRALSWIFR